MFQSANFPIFLRLSCMMCVSVSLSASDQHSFLHKLERRVEGEDSQKFDVDSKVRLRP